MCYSAQIVASYKSYVRRFGAELSIHDFVELYSKRDQFGRIVRFSKAMDVDFLEQPDSDGERSIAALIAKFRAEQIPLLEQEVFKQRRRVVDAQRTLDAGKITKKAQEDVRIGSNKVAQAIDWLEDLKRTSIEPGDSRIYPRWYAPVLYVENRRRRVAPMRYLLRPEHMPASFDNTHSGSYNARRDNLRKFWRNQYEATRGIILVDTFFEHVYLHNAEGRELRDGELPKDVVIQFAPDPPQRMTAACIWSHWQRSGEESLMSFALLTDEPPPEVAAAGHDRCIIPLRDRHLDAWLDPANHDLDALDAILDDREPMTYRHRLASERAAA